MTLKKTQTLSTSVIALCTALAAPALADVNAADVWANQQTLYAGMGITLSGNLADDALSGVMANIILPQGLASMQISTDATVTMADNGNGTVTVTYPSPMTIKVAGAVQDEGSFSAEITVTHDGYSVVASGDANDISYSSQASNLRFEPGEITVDGTPMDADDFEITGFMEMTEWATESRVTIGNLINYTASTTYGSTSAEFAFTADGVEATNTQSTQPMDAVVTATLPIGGSDVMNLSAAARDGLSFSAESSSTGSVSFNQTLVNGEVLNSQATSVGDQSAVVSFGEDGLVMTGTAETFQLSINEPMIFPGDLAFAAELLTMNYDVPLHASDEPQDFRVATSLQGFTMGDTIWNLFDPANQLPRDPAEITFDITGVGTNGVDLLDVMALSQMTGPPAIEVDEVTIENLRIAAVGAEVMAQGAMTFDWSDFQTIPGVPRPEGEVTVNLNGANALMDKLVLMGFLPEDQLMMPRMMMGMFATPVGDDMLQSVIEVNSEGHILANGQRLQ